jgi:DNA-directed RNA polymerase specialized sigma24 family protein
MTRQRDTVGQPTPRLPQRSATGDRLDAAPLDASGRSPQVMWAVETLQIMDGLNRLDRVALQLIYWTGLTQAQVAEELGVPLMTVRACVADGMHE